MLVYLDVAASVAVKAGKVKSGTLPVAITEEWLASLTDAEREVVASCVYASPPSSSPTPIGGWNNSLPRVSEATLDTLLVLVRAKAAADAEKAAKESAEKAERAAKYTVAVELANQMVLDDPSNAVYPIRTPGELSLGCTGDGSTHAVSTPCPHPSVRFDDLSDEAKAKAVVFAASVKAEIARRKVLSDIRAKEAAEQQRQAAKLAAEEAKRFREACDALILQVGTEDQKGRLEDELLPQAEADQIVRDYVYSPLKAFDRYEKLTKDDVEHEDDENGYDCEGNVKFEADDADEMPGGPWRTLVAIRKVAPDGSVVTPRYHKAECEMCNGTTERYSAKVEVTWHGKTFCREYSL